MPKLFRVFIGFVMMLTAGHVAAASDLAVTWTQKSYTGGYPARPGGRTWIDTIYDPVNKRTVLFGGSAGTYLNDIFHYDSTNDLWTQIEPHVPNCPGFMPPTQRDEHALEYDSYNHLYWSFGGSGYAYPCLTSSAQSGTDTLTVVDNTLPSTVTDYYKDYFVYVAGRTAYVTSYDPATKTLKLAVPITGLTAGTTYLLYPQGGGGTWYYSPVSRTWASLDGPHWDYTGPKPGNRLSPGFAYSTRDNVFLMFGGGGAANDTWVLDAVTKSWKLMRPSWDPTSPLPLAQLTTSLVYDSHNDVFILFGGRCSGDGACPIYASNSETWVYKYATNTWTNMKPAISPSPRQQHQMAFDPVHRVAVMFGGHNGTPNFYNELWVYDYAANTWTQLTQPTAPPPRYIGAFSYDSDQQLFVLYGGVEPTIPAYGSTSAWTLKLGGVAANQPPVAVATVSPAEGNVGALFQFDAATSTDADGVIASYAWNFGDGATSSMASPTHQYAAPGAYTVTLAVTDNDGATATTALLVTVTAATPPPVITLTSGLINGTVNDLGVTQILVNGSAIPVTNGAFQIPALIGGGTTILNLEVTGSGGTGRKRVTITVE